MSGAKRKQNRQGSDCLAPLLLKLFLAAAPYDRRIWERSLQSVERAIAGHNTVLNSKQADDVILSHIATLTPRERQVFELIIRGKSNKAVANLLGSTERTIKAHRHRVMKKMQVPTLAELVSLAERAGVLKDQHGTR